MSGFNTQTKPKSRKIYECCECFQKIPKGVIYCRNKGMFDGSFYDATLHLECNQKAVELNHSHGQNTDWYFLNDWDGESGFSFKDHQEMIIEKYQLNKE